MRYFKKKGNSLIIFIMFLTSFLLGFIFSQYVDIKLNNNLLKTNFETEKKSIINKNLNLEKFWQVYNVVKENYFDIEKIKKKDIIDGIIKGFINSLGDKHSEFMTVKEKEIFENTLSGDFEGIGAVVEKNEIGVVIDRILKGSPSQKYGLKKGDIILKANNIKLEDLNLYEAVDKIKGPSGTKVLLTILRRGEKDLLEIEVVRKKIIIPSVEGKKLEKSNIGYIALNMFGDNTTMEFKKTLKELEKENINGLILDLRDNGGGYLQKAVEILSLFIKNGEVLVQTKYKDNLFNRAYYSINNGTIFDKKIIVLINSNSASASEITAGALSEYKKAILVGEKTYGKGSVQQPFMIDDGSLVKLTIAKWFTPNGKNIDKEGINPDIEIKFKKEDYDFDICKKVGKCKKNMKEEDFKFYDRQLEEAKKILKEFIKTKSIQITINKEKERLKKENKIEK